MPELLFRFFGGARDFNPMALVFERLRWVDAYRFWQPYRDAKHGRLEALDAIEAAFFDHLGIDQRNED